jgi:hypothetical protein
MPDLDAVVDAEAGREGRSEQETTVGGPFAVRRVRGVNGANLREGAPVNDLDLPGEVTKPSESNESALGIKRDEVVW